MENGFLIAYKPDQLADLASSFQILQTNDHAGQFGLRLSETDAAELLATRRIILQDEERVEISGKPIVKIIDAFCDSAYINQADYAETLHELLEIFYILKNETFDLIHDDELIDLMKTHFNGRCAGSLELLVSRELERIARNIRAGRPIDADEDLDDDEETEEDYYEYDEYFD